MYPAPEHLRRLREKFVNGPEDLVVEGVSEFSSQRDRLTATSGVRAVPRCASTGAGDAEEERAEICRLNADEAFEVHAAGGSGVLRSEVLPGFYVRAEWLWGEQPPDQIAVAREWGLI